MASDSQACLSFRQPEPCDGCYLWHPYSVCFVMFVLSLPILGLVLGILDLINDQCPTGLALQIWLISYSYFLLCYEIYFFSDLPAYWSNLYARLCSEKIRTCCFNLFTSALFLSWCAGWMFYSVYDSCQSDQLGLVALVVLLVSMVEALIVGCFCFVTYQVRSWIRDDHPSNRRNVGRDTDPLLHWAVETEREGGLGGTSSRVGIRGRISAMIHERDTIATRNQNTYSSNHRVKMNPNPPIPADTRITIDVDPQSNNIAPVAVDHTGETRA